MAQIQVRDALGRKVWVPEHYMNHPVLSRGFTALPSAGKRSTAQAAALPQNGGDQLPDESWSHDQIDKFAADQHPPVDLTGATTKAEKLSALNSQGG